MKKPKNYWDNKDTCLDEALKYDKITDFKHNSVGAYRSSRKNGWFAEATKHMGVYHKPERKSWSYWNDKDRCSEEALKYRTRTEFKRKSQGAWASAHKNGWFDDITKHMNVPIIYGVKTGDVFHYIGKMANVRKDAKLKNSNVMRQYTCPNIRSIFLNNQNVDVVQIKATKNALWYDEKLSEVLLKHNEKHPLLNAEWMLEGKRGYWEGKERDRHTLQRLSESKHRKVIEYDANGNYVKTWNSIKEIAVEIFKDYRLINGSANSKIYGILNYSYKKISNRFRNNSYWFKEKELIENFNCIPIRLKINVIKENEIKNHHIERKTVNRTTTSKYSVVLYNEDNTIKTTYNNIDEAGRALKLSRRTIMRSCNGTTKNPKHLIKYGLKISQAINQK